MNPGVRIVILISAAILVIVAFSLSGQVHPIQDRLPVMSEQVPLGPENARPSFILTVTPTKAYARPGDPVDCEVTITPQNGFNETVELQLKVDAGPVFRGTYNAGVMNPPYPRTYEYRVVVPLQAPAPLMVNGTLRAMGGGHSEEINLVLFIEP
ncbi:MAG: hypothetical protein LLF84_04025 [Methanoregulaceae archaeon]|nr:hypothetical protein [Methanoregulaceae archaeon]